MRKIQINFQKIGYLHVGRRATLTTLAQAGECELELIMHLGSFLSTIKISYVAT